MSRKTKVADGTKSINKNISLHRSLVDYVTVGEGRSFSKYLQQKICEDVTGTTFEDFVVDIYSLRTATDARSHSTDTLEQEFYRMARWMCEGEILEEIEHIDKFSILKIRWRTTGLVCWVKVDLCTEGYKHVIYDEVVNYNPDVYGEGDSIIIYGSGPEIPAKWNLLQRWKEVSQMMDGAE